MIIDSSAILAILKGEPEAESIAASLEDADQLRISAATWLETSVVVDRFRNPLLSARLDEIFSNPRLIVDPFTPEQAIVARQAYRDFGKGSGHPSSLNFGDCFSYALAHTRREPLLYKGDDFRHTNLRSALEPS